MESESEDCEHDQEKEVQEKTSQVTLLIAVLSCMCATTCYVSFALHMHSNKVHRCSVTRSKAHQARSM